MEAHQPRTWILRAVLLAHQRRPDATRRAVLRNLLEEVQVRVEEERQPGREVVDVETALERPLDVRESVGERKREFLRSGRTGLADVVAEIEIGCHNGISRDVNSTMSVTSRIDGSGGKMNSFCAMTPSRCPSESSRVTSRAAHPALRRRTRRTPATSPPAS